METNTTRTAASTLGTCGKCDGRGHIDAFATYANGVCFWCEGTGKLACTGAAPRELVNLAIWAAVRVMCSVHRDSFDGYAMHYARLLAKDLFALGTEGAREVLHFILVGKGQDETGRNFRISPASAAEIRAYVIEEGFKMKQAR